MAQNATGGDQTAWANATRFYDQATQQIKMIVQVGKTRATLAMDWQLLSFVPCPEVKETSPGVYVVQIDVLPQPNVVAVPGEDTQTGVADQWMPEHLSMGLSWTVPSAGIHSTWQTSFKRLTGIPTAWTPAWSCKATANAPVCVLHSLDGSNKLTFALSDALHRSRLRVGLLEETAQVYCSMEWSLPNARRKERATFHCLLDFRNLPYYETLDSVRQWWETWFTPCAVPTQAWQPVYSTWYSLHQHVIAEDVETQCRLAKQLFDCSTVIVDDGWQTLDNQRGYAFTGDWQVCKQKISDMRDHVAKVHALGMKYVLWYSVPFVGFRSLAVHDPSVANQVLAIDYDREAVIVDPRYRSRREAILSTYERAMIEWDVDGFKLDFVDSFNAGNSQDYLEQQPSQQSTLASQRENRDYDDVEEAVDALLQEMLQRLKKIKADVMIEFRQSYVGPAMRRYGNMFRAADCPNDMMTNRERIIDLRLLTGDGTAVHSDMLMWDVGEPVESAALHLLNCLFSVPQISVRLNLLPDSHCQMLQFWLQKFWTRYRDLLLHGKLIPLHPETHYPCVLSYKESQSSILAVCYQSNTVVDLSTVPTWKSEKVVAAGDDGWTVIVVNATTCHHVVVDFAFHVSQSDPNDDNDNTLQSSSLSGQTEKLTLADTATEKRIVRRRGAIYDCIGRQTRQMVETTSSGCRVGLERIPIDVGGYAVVHFEGKSEDCVRQTM